MDELLRAWILMSTAIKGNRLLEELSLNEMIIASSLYNYGPSSAVFLCKETNLLKSQMNRLLTNMETRGLIARVKSSEDKRKLVVELTSAGKEIYLKEHALIQQVLDKVNNKLGIKKATTLANLMKEAVKAVSE